MTWVYVYIFISVKQSIPTFICSYKINNFDTRAKKTCYVILLLTIGNVISILMRLTIHCYII